MDDPENPNDDGNLGGDYARDTHRDGFGDDYAREKPISEEQQPKEEIGIGKASE